MQPILPFGDPCTRRPSKNALLGPPPVRGGNQSHPIVVLSGLRSLKSDGNLKGKEKEEARRENSKPQQRQAQQQETTQTSSSCCNLDKKKKKKTPPKETDTEFSGVISDGNLHFTTLLFLASSFSFISIFHFFLF